MRLEDIGFYTLCNARASTSSIDSPLWRCELILTDECNFKCPYCRGLREDVAGVLPYDVAMATVRLWCSDDLKNVRFSGGEPTLYPGLDTLIRYCRDHGVEHIALSTNGSANIEYYRYLIDCGVNDMSISLDSGCCSVGDAMAGGIPGSWNAVTTNIRALSKLTYVTVGIVFTEDNAAEALDTITLAASLGVADIRIIPAAQYDSALRLLANLSEDILTRYPILRYRILNAKNGRPVRGLPKNAPRCRLVLDDMAVAGGYHFPCIIYMREGGDPIGYVGKEMRQEREAWMRQHQPGADPICSKMCLDVCKDFNVVASKEGQSNDH